jgi:hypothetical protein
MSHVQMTDTRDNKLLCAHALSAFSFLETEGFVSSQTVSPSWFTIDYANPQCSFAIQIGAFLPRYEYYVAIDSGGQRISLDEIERILEPINHDPIQWTWAHSDPTEFARRISYSALLLRRNFMNITQGFENIRRRIANLRAEALEYERIRDRAIAADNAFRHGRWNEALEIYRSLPSLTQVQQKRMSIASRKG